MRSSAFSAFILSFAATSVFALPVADGSSPTQCATGVNYGIYINGSPSTAKTVADWDPSSLEDKQADYHGTTSSVGFGDMSISGLAPGHKGSLYGNGPFLTGHFGVRYFGFIYAYADGDYTFTIINSDDATYVYGGSDLSEQPSTRVANSLGMSLLWAGSPNQTPVTKKVAAVKAGNYIPFSILWANVLQGKYRLAVKITGPDGTVLLDGNGSKNIYVDRMQCDRSSWVWTTSGLS